jgi:hypothetical protein
MSSWLLLPSLSLFPVTQASFGRFFLGLLPLLTAAKAAGFDGPVTPWADRATLVGRGREKIVKLAGDRLEAAWKEAGLPIVPRWFTPVQRDQFGRPIGEDAAFIGAE